MWQIAIDGVNCTLTSETALRLAAILKPPGDFGLYLSLLKGFEAEPERA